MACAPLLRVRTSLLLLCLLQFTQHPGTADERAFRQIEKREYAHHPYSAWYYIGSTENYHVLKHSVLKLIGGEHKVWLEKKYLQIDQPFEFDRKSEQSLKVNIAIEDEDIRFWPEDQEPQSVPYAPLYDWSIYREHPTYADHQKRDRSFITLWQDDIRLFADSIKESSAKGDVLVEFPAKPTKNDPEPAPHLFYGDQIHFDIAEQKATISGDVAAEKSHWDDHLYYAMSPETEIRLKGTRYDIDGPHKSRKKSTEPFPNLPISPSEDEGAKPRPLVELPDLTAYLLPNRPSIELWGEMNVFADELEEFRGEGLVYLHSGDADQDGRTFEVFGDRVDWDPERKHIRIRGVVVVKSEGRPSIAQSPWAEFIMEESMISLRGPYVHQIPAP